MAVFHGRSKAGDSTDVLGARPVSEFLTAAAQQRLKSLHPLGRESQRRHLSTANLVRREGHKIGIHRIDIKWYFTERLDRVDMQQSAGGMDNPSHLGNRLHRAGFVVGQHHRHQRGRPVR